MQLLKATPMLITTNIRDTIDFYVNVLGFQCENFVEGWGWASLVKDEVRIMLSTPNDHENFEEPCLTGSIYFKTDNVEEIWCKLKDKTIVCYELETFDYGMKEFAIYDNNGYMLQFGQEIN